MLLHEELLGRSLALEEAGLRLSLLLRRLCGCEAALLRSFLPLLFFWFFVVTSWMKLHAGWHARPS